MPLNIYLILFLIFSNGVSILFYCNIISIKLHFDEFILYCGTLTHDFDLITLEYAGLETNSNIIWIEGYTVFHSLS